MQSFANGKVEIIKQGYLLKRTSSLRGDWKRRFFVLDSQGTLYYYRNKGIEPMGSLHQYAGSAEHNSGVFSRFRANHNRSSSFNEETLGYHPIDLRISTIKMDSEDTDLRLCFRIISPLKTYTLQVRSLTLDVKVWEPSIVELFRSLGNAYCNSVWEGSLQNERVDEPNALGTSIKKPCSKDPISHREKYINAKYVEKLLIVRDAMEHGGLPHSASIWQAVKADNLREVYRLIAISDTNIINTTFDDVFTIELHHHAVDTQVSSLDSNKEDEREQYDPSTCPRIMDSNEPGNCLQGCSVLHLACEYGNPVMVELLLQFGANINMRDFHGRTPLQHGVSKGNNQLAKLRQRRGAVSTIKDGGGLSALERAMEKGAITDEELFILLSEVK